MPGCQPVNAPTTDVMLIAQLQEDAAVHTVPDVELLL